MIKRLRIGLLSCLISTVLWSVANSSEQKENTAFRPMTLFLKGSPYELGYQHGQQLKEAIAYNVNRLVDDKLFANLENPQIQSFLAMLPQVLEHIPVHYLQELKGLAEGAQLPYEKILLLNLFPEMFHCSGLTVTGEATKQKEMYHVRVLDYNVGQNLQDTAVLMVVQPDGKIPFLNVSYAGFIGSITGMNSQHIAVGEIGGKGYGQYLGIPMAFLLRRILEEANNLKEIETILALSSRTCEYYYVFSDGKTRESLGVYATGQQLKFFTPGTSYAIFDAVRPNDTGHSEQMNEKIVLNDAQIDLYPFQTLLYKDQNKTSLWGLIHQQPKDCLVLTGFSHLKRYSILVQRILKRYGKIDPLTLQAILKDEGGSLNNLHVAIFAPTALEAWIAHADPKSGEPAWNQAYEHFNLRDLLQQAKSK